MIAFLEKGAWFPMYCILKLELEFLSIFGCYGNRNSVLSNSYH